MEQVAGGAGNTPPVSPAQGTDGGTGFPGPTPGNLHLMVAVEVEQLTLEQHGTILSAGGAGGMVATAFFGQHHHYMEHQDQHWKIRWRWWWWKLLIWNPGTSPGAGGPGGGGQGGGRAGGISSSWW